MKTLLLLGFLYHFVVGQNFGCQFSSTYTLNSQAIYKCELQNARYPVSVEIATAATVSKGNYTVFSQLETADGEIFTDPIVNSIDNEVNIPATFTLATAVDPCTTNILQEGNSTLHLQLLSKAIVATSNFNLSVTFNYYGIFLVFLKCQRNWKPD
jgi:hypothetical protein